MLIKYLSYIKDCAGTDAVDFLEYLWIGPIVKAVNWGASV